MIRTQALRDAGGYDESIFYEDHDVCLRLARSHDLVCVDEPLATHRELATALGRKFFQPEYRDEWLAARVRLLEKHLGFRDDCNALIAGLILELTWQRYLAGSAGPREPTRSSRGCRRTSPLRRSACSRAAASLAPCTDARSA